MKITSIEPTPSPHSMKINVTERLSDGETFNYKKTDDLTNAPAYVRELFDISDIINIYRVVDFITIARQPRIAWEDILPAVRDVIGTKDGRDIFELPKQQASEEDTTFGEVF